MKLWRSILFWNFPEMMRNFIGQVIRILLKSTLFHLSVLFKHIVPLHDPVFKLGVVELLYGLKIRFTPVCRKARQKFSTFFWLTLLSYGHVAMAAKGLELRTNKVEEINLSLQYQQIFHYYRSAGFHTIVVTKPCQAVHTLTQYEQEHLISPTKRTAILECSARRWAWK